MRLLWYCDIGLVSLLCAGCAHINSNGDVIGTFPGTTSIEHGFLRQADGTFITVDAPGASIRLPIFENVSGEMAGYMSDAQTLHGFVRSTDGSYTIFDPPGVGGSGTVVSGINARGVSVGYCSDNNSVTHGFVRNTDGTFTVLEDPDSSQTSGSITYATGINDSGAIVGYFVESKALPHGFIRQ